MTTQTVARRDLPTRRWFIIVPLLGLSMFMLNLDRTNISLLIAPISKELGLSLSGAGLISSILFIGSVAFQIPLVVLVHKFGGRWVLAGCLLIWGIASAACGLATTEVHLLIARFVVGIGESAFHPIMYVLIAFWFVERERGRANTRFFIFSLAASVLTAPLTGFMLQYMTWHLVLIIQGVPAVVLGIVWLFLYDDDPTKVFWLPRAEGERVRHAVHDEQRLARQGHQQVGFLRALLNRRLVLLMVIYGLLGGGASAIPLWLPTVVRGFSGNASSLVIGVLSGVPFLVGGIIGVLLGIAADRTSRFRALMLIPLAIGSVVLMVSPVAGGAVLQLVLLCVVVSGVQGTVPIFYAFPSWMLSRSVLTVGIGLINVVGTLVAFFATYLVGWVGGMTTPAIGFATLGIVLGAAAIVGAVALKDPPTARLGTTTRPATSRQPATEVA